MEPPGTRGIIHEKQYTRKTYISQSVDSCYTGPTLDNYCCFRTWVWWKDYERIAGTLDWLPVKFRIPKTSSSDCAEAVVHVLGHPTQYFICDISSSKSQKILLENSPAHGFPLFIYTHYFELKIKNRQYAPNIFQDNLIILILTCNRNSYIF